MTDERYHPGFMNEEEYAREQTRQKDMVESIIREYSRAQEEKILERLDMLLGELEKVAQELAKTTMILKVSLRSP